MPSLMGDGAGGDAGSNSDGGAGGAGSVAAGQAAFGGGGGGGGQLGAPGACRITWAAVAAFVCTRHDATCGALGDFYTSTAGAGWLNSSGWASAASGTPTDYCTFYGITCDSGGGLTRLCVCAHCVSAQLMCSAEAPRSCACSYLQSNQLSGSIPSSLGSLTGLVFLCVRRTAGRATPALC